MVDRALTSLKLMLSAAEAGGEFFDALDPPTPRVPSTLKGVSDSTWNEIFTLCEEENTLTNGEPGTCCRNSNGKYLAPSRKRTGVLVPNRAA